MNTKIKKSYEGRDKYIFVSYSHRDKKQVMPIINKLIEDGFRVWYDEGIEFGDEWPSNIEEHLSNCYCFLAFISNNAIESQNCRREINFAIRKNKNILVSYISEVKFKYGLELQLTSLQSFYLQNERSNDRFYRKLLSTAFIKHCHDQQQPTHINNFKKEHKKTNNWNLNRKAKILLGIFLIALGAIIFYQISYSTGTSAEGINTSIYFGNYPQQLLSGYLLKDEVVNSSYDENNNTIINERKYHRVYSDSIPVFDLGGDYTDFFKEYNPLGHPSKLYNKYYYFKYDSILWRAIKVTDDYVILLSEKIIDFQPFNNTLTDITWSTSSIRKWLNYSFVERAFNPAEMEMLLKVAIDNERNESYNTLGGETELDRVFLLKRTEVEDKSMGFASYNHFNGSHKTRIAFPTEYANVLGLIQHKDNTASPWYLRSMGQTNKTAANVTSEGTISHWSFYCNNVTLPSGIRPAILISRTAYNNLINKSSN